MPPSGRTAELGLYLRWLLYMRVIASPWLICALSSSCSNHHKMEEEGEIHLLISFGWPASQDELSRTVRWLSDNRVLIGQDFAGLGAVSDIPGEAIAMQRALLSASLHDRRVTLSTRRRGTLAI